jgi:hypothetical protein|nr:MAG TPA: hypothetical protein [Caudoviricetes sp.]
MNFLNKINEFFTEQSIELYVCDLFSPKIEKEFIDRDFYMFKKVKGSFIVIENIETSEILEVSKSELFKNFNIFTFLDKDSVLNAKKVLRLSKEKDIEFYIGNKAFPTNITRYKVLKGTKVENNILNVNIIQDKLEFPFKIDIRDFPREIYIK